MQADENVFEAVPHSFHAAEATGVSTCVRKPLVATCSLDRTLRLWNTQDWCAAHFSMSLSMKVMLCVIARQWHQKGQRSSKQRVRFQALRPFDSAKPKFALIRKGQTI